MPHHHKGFPVKALLRSRQASEGLGLWWELGGKTLGLS